MPNPGQSITRTDGNLGLSGTRDDRFLYVGTCSAGVANSLTTFYSSTALRSALGSGPVVEAAAWELDTTGRPVDVLVTGSSVTATTSVVTGASSPAVTVAGTPGDFYDTIVEVTLGGALGVGRFRYSLDGGQTPSEELTIPAGGTYAIAGTGLTLTFTTGTYVVGSVYSFSCVPATYGADDLTAAWVTVMAAHDSWPTVVFTGHAASAAAAATLAAAIHGLMVQLVNDGRYGRALVSTGEGTEAEILAAWPSAESVLVAAFAGKARIANGATIGFRNPLLPYVYEAARRAAAVKISTNPAHVGFAEDPDNNPLARVSEPSYDARTAGSGLFDAKINCPTTHSGRRISGHPEVLPNSFLMRSPFGSDYRHWQWCRVMDVLSAAVQSRQQEWVNGNVETRADGTGRVDPGAAKGLEAVVLADLDKLLVKPSRDDGKKGHITGKPVYKIDLTNDVLRTGVLRSTAKVVPLANVELLETKLGFATEI